MAVGNKPFAGTTSRPCQAYLGGGNQALSAARASDQLTLFGDTHPPSVLYFLFGRLYHAVSDGAVGDEAVIRALGRTSGEYEFNAAARLPEESSVTSTLPQLLGQTR